MEEVRDDRAEKAYARAVASMLLACIVAGLIFAEILTNFQGGFYIPLFMPYLLGRATGSLAVGVGQRWLEPPLKPTIACAIAGSVVTVLAYQALAYQAVLSLLEQDALPDLNTWLQEVTGAQGWSAYLALITDPDLGFAGNISPFGVVGEFLTSPGLFFGVLALELTAGAFGAARGVDRGLKTVSSHVSKSADIRLVAQVAAAQLDPILVALEDGNFVRAGKLIAETEPDPDIRISIVFPENEDAPHILRIIDQRNGSLRARYRFSIDQALLMMDQIRLAEAKRLYGTDDEPSA